MTAEGHEELAGAPGSYGTSGGPSLPQGESKLGIEMVDLERHIVVKVYHRDRLIRDVGVFVKGYVGVKVGNEIIDIKESEEVGYFDLEEIATEEILDNIKTALGRVSYDAEKKYLALAGFLKNVRELADTYGAKVRLSAVLESDP
jgi:hypothetical protein